MACVGQWASELNKLEGLKSLEKVLDLCHLDLQFGVQTLRLALGGASVLWALTYVHNT